MSPYINAVAFEDLYYPPGTKPATNRIPDYDYNDFLTEFQITEKANSSNDITDIYIDFYPRAVGAGDDHSFKLVLTGKVTGSSANSSILPITKPMFQGKATVTLSYFDENGKPKGTTTSPAYDQDIIVFSSTHATLGDPAGSSAQLNTLLPAGYTSGVPSNYREAVLNARIHVQLLSPTLNPAPSNGLVDASTFRVILHDLKSNYDIDIINVDNHNFDVNGYPWGFIIPTSWQWMQEGELIDSGYPEFAQYKNFLLGKPATGDYMNWFKYPVADPNKTILYPVIPFAPFLPAP